MSQTVERLFRANVYVEGQGHAGAIEEIDLPSLKWAGADLKTIAMVGKSKLPTSLDELKVTMKGHLQADIVAVASDPTRFRNVQIRSNSVKWGGEGIEEEVAAVVYARGWFEEVNLGSVKGQENASGAQYVLHCVACKLQIGARVLFDIDLYQSKVVIDGTDVFATSNANLGI